MSVMLFVKLNSIMFSIFFLVSANIYLLQGNTDRFYSRLALAVGIALVYKLLNFDQYKYVESKKEKTEFV